MATGGPTHPENVRKAFASPVAGGSLAQLAERMKNDICFACRQKGHWAAHCPTRRSGGPSTAVASAGVIPEWNCRCGGGPCLVRASKTPKNPGRRFYCCPGRQEGQNCNFFQWCDMACNPHAKPFRPACSCQAGNSRLYEMPDGPHAGRAYFGCSIKKGDGACNFFQWCDEIQMLNGHPDGTAPIVRDECEAARIPYLDNTEDSDDLEQRIEEALKRKFAEANEAENSADNKKMKMTVPGQTYLLAHPSEPARPMALEGGAEVLKFEKFTPPSSEASKLGCPEPHQVFIADSFARCQIIPFSGQASGARRRLTFEEGEPVTDVSDKILGLTNNLLPLTNPYRLKEQEPPFAPFEEQFQQSRAATEAENLKFAAECSRTITQLKNYKVTREIADLAVKDLEAQLCRAQQEAIAANAREQEAQGKFRRLQEDHNQIFMQLGTLATLLEDEETQHRERLVSFDVEKSKRMKDLAVLDEAAKDTISAFGNRFCFFKKWFFDKITFLISKLKRGP